MRRLSSPTGWRWPWGDEVQTLAVALIVALSFVYAAWTLMPRRWRQALAQRLLRWPGLGRLAAVQRAARAPAGGCGSCDSCDSGPTTPRDGSQVIRIVHPPR
jgi:hypothetical protein